MCGAVGYQVKTGYGLDFETELKMLRTIQTANLKHRMVRVSCGLSSSLSASSSLCPLPRQSLCVDAVTY